MPLDNTMPAVHGRVADAKPATVEPGVKPLAVEAAPAVTAPTSALPAYTPKAFAATSVPSITPQPVKAHVAKLPTVKPVAPSPAAKPVTKPVAQPPASKPVTLGASRPTAAEAKPAAGKSEPPTVAPHVPQIGGPQPHAVVPRPSAPSAANQETSQGGGVSRHIESPPAVDYSRIVWRDGPAGRR